MNSQDGWAMRARMTFLQHSAHDVPGVLGRLARDAGWAVEVCRSDEGADSLPALGSFDALVVMGSDRSTLDSTVGWIGPERALVAGAVESGVPVLGVCFGGQLLAQVLGGQVTRADRPEIGWRAVETSDPVRIPSGPWLVWHEDAFTAPPGAEALARTEVSLHAFVCGIHTGVQFHPEVTREIVGHWVDDARARGHLDPEQAEELLAGFDADGAGPEEQTALLLEGFFRRAGHPWEAPRSDPSRSADAGP
jgi:GMP synthase (glutamine-hydrolysing)